MKSPRFDIDLDKHYKATVVIECPACGHENRHHLSSLQPDSALACTCGHDISLGAQGLQSALDKAAAIKAAYHINAA